MDGQIQLNISRKKNDKLEDLRGMLDSKNGWRSDERNGRL
jgi:hypothetical protein